MPRPPDKKAGPRARGDTGQEADSGTDRTAQDAWGQGNGRPAWLKPYLPVPVKVAANSNLTPGARLLFGAIVHRIGRNQHTWAGEDVLAADIGVSIRTLRRRVRELEEEELIEVQRRGNRLTNTCRLRSDPSQDPSDRTEVSDHNQGVTGQNGSSDRTDLVSRPDKSGQVTGQKCPLPYEQLQEQHQRTTSEPNQGGCGGKKSNGLELEDLPDDLRTDRFKTTWSEWEQHCREMDKTLKATTIIKQLKKLAKMGHDQAIESINMSINCGCTDVFKPSKNWSARRDGRVAKA